MKEPSAIRDERTIVIENASYRWGYLVISYGLLALIALRGFLLKQSNWDLMALVIISSLITTAYQGLHQIFTRRWVYVFAATILVSAITAAFIIFFVR